MELAKDLTGLESYIPFKTPLSLILSGASFSGKTFFLAELIKNKSKMFIPEPVEILFVYSAWQEIYNDLEKQIPGIRFVNRIPSKEEIEQFTEDNKPRMLCLDDQMTRLDGCPHIIDYFTIYTHHRNLSCVLLLQNIFHQGAKCLRDISLNTQGLILFRNMRSPQQISTLASQMFPGKKRKYFLNSYELATSKPHGYLFVDINAANDQTFQLRSDILPGKNTIVYLPTEG